MKCTVCKINEAEKGSIVCSENCQNIRLMVLKLTSKYTPTHGCENCLGDLHIGCTDKCRQEFQDLGEFVKELYLLIELSKNIKKKA